MFKSICFLVLLITILEVHAFGQVFKVIGEAEGLFEPDYVELAIDLQQTEKKKDGHSFSEQEAKLRSVVRNLGLDTSVLEAERFYSRPHLGSLIPFEKKIFYSKKYRLSIYDVTRYEEVVAALVREGFEYVSIDGYGLMHEADSINKLVALAMQNGKAKARMIQKEEQIATIRLISIEELDEAPQPSNAWSTRSVVTIGGASTIPRVNLSKIRRSMRFALTFKGDFSSEEYKDAIRSQR